jgi:hypothetical protein
MGSRRVGDVEDVVAHGVRAVHRVHRSDRRAQLGRRRDGRQRIERLDAALAVEDLALGRTAGQTQRAHEREPVELALGQRERPRAPERVLRRDQKERLGQLMRRAVDRRLPLLHRLEQRGLCARGCAVDLVDEHDVVEDRSRSEVPQSGRRTVDRGAGDVGRQEVGRALHPSEAAADCRGHRLGEQRLAGSRHSFDEQVAARQQRDQREADRFRGAAHRARHRVEQLRCDRARVALRRGVG